ncbi:hypothetical protein DB30_06946 [Enhygromyxa salina]|uniref:Uncharacterized protein n=1 Tax=Enhygromyxa salina TaxID=215803 RepID=A0A0C1Z9T4_9BACT|nr:hypothetical protein [Enhygromyxa salina]KIG14344.1 hypothetical protein DB30_06946 [Enhygromyxa salina]
MFQLEINDFVVISVFTFTFTVAEPKEAVDQLATSAPPQRLCSGRDRLKKVLGCPSNPRAVLHSERDSG